MQLGLALEYSLGHVTHAQNLQTHLSGLPSMQSRVIRLSYDARDQWWQRLPGVRSNWSLRASLGARIFLLKHLTGTRGLFFHSQVTSLLSTDLMHRIPSVVSLDATPLQYDQLGASYKHATGSAGVERLKKRLNVRSFTAASNLVTWSEWAKASLVNDYGIASSKVTVIPPGIDVQTWHFPERDLHQPVQLLFVGGDFYRKGGATLLAAWERLSPKVRQRATLNIVTKTENIRQGIPSVHLHYGLVPNSPELKGLYRAASAFVFPSDGDCLPLSVLEALASGLAVLTTDVAALPEAVEHNRCGLIIPPGDVMAWSSALEQVITDHANRTAWGREARVVAESRFDANVTYKRLVRVMAGDDIASQVAA